MSCRIVDMLTKKTWTAHCADQSVTEQLICMAIGLILCSHNRNNGRSERDTKQGRCTTGSVAVSSTPGPLHSKQHKNRIQRCAVITVTKSQPPCFSSRSLWYFCDVSTGRTAVRLNCSTCSPGNPVWAEVPAVPSTVRGVLNEFHAAHVRCLLPPGYDTERDLPLYRAFAEATGRVIQLNTDTKPSHLMRLIGAII